MDKLWMANPTLPDNPAVPVTRLAYNDVWQPRGWQLVDTPDSESELASPHLDGEAFIPLSSPTKPPADTGDEPDTDDDAGPATPPTGKGRKSS